ncbi:MAG: endonuclease III domain-containing protein [Candidatus Altiarchaeales archaeon]|nr:MAG: endonuclease III domain-containing protein [Candidatus Altiarchaeales archaeon]
MANLIDIYHKLLEHFGEQGWWPAETEFEVIVGAILTQASSWTNVEKAIENLKSEGLLSPEALLQASEEKLRRLIKPVGYYNAKTLKLKRFVEFLHENYEGDLDKLFDRDTEKLRLELLSVWGIGQETADSIILYAANKPTFVIDAYTKRIMSRLGLVNEDTTYSDLKKFFELQLPGDLEIYKEFHALLVELGKNYCKTKPLCGKCPIRDICAEWKSSSKRN